MMKLINANLFYSIDCVCESRLLDSQRVNELASERVKRVQGWHPCTANKKESQSSL